jgi:hypothetical protein
MGLVSTKEEQTVNKSKAPKRASNEGIAKKQGVTSKGEAARDDLQPDQRRESQIRGGIPTFSVYQKRGKTTEG